MFLDFVRDRKNLIAPIVMLTIALGLLVFNSVAGQGKRISPLSRAILGILSHPQALVKNTANGMKGGWSRYVYLRGVEKENRTLREELNTLAWEAQKMREDGARLRMGLTEPIWPGMRIINAKIIALPEREELGVVTINKGADDGVKFGMAVICGRGVVGKVIGGGDGRLIPAHIAQILLLTDPRCRVDALIYRTSTDQMPDPVCPWNPVNWSQTRIRGVVQGVGKGLTLKYIQRGTDIQVGDMVVSSGLGGVFPKGLLLGRVSGVNNLKKDMTLDVKLAPAVDFNSAEEVQVIIKTGDQP